MFIRNALLVLAAIVLMGTACQPPAQEISQLTEEDVAAIEGIIQQYIQSMLAKDLDAWTDFWAEDAVMMPPNSPALEGREAIIRDWMAGPTPTKFILDVVEVDGGGDLAYVRGTYSITMTVAGVSEPMMDKGKYLSILKKQPDATWLFTIDIWNSDLPLPEEGSEAET